MFGGGSTSLSGQDSKILSLRVSQSTQGITKTVVYGKTRVSGNVVWYGDFTAHEHYSSTSAGKGGGGSGSTSVSYTYTASLMLALGMGTISSVTTVWKDSSEYALADLGFELHSGAVGQSPWSYLSSSHADVAYPYSGLAYAACANYDLGTDASTPQWSFEVVGNLSSASNGDALPSAVISDIWTNTTYGLSQDSSVLHDMSDYALWCSANGFTVSMACSTQQEARSWMQQVLDATLAVAIPSQGTIKVIPLGDQAVGSWSPNATPDYDLTDNDFLSIPTFSRTQPRDAYNRVTLAYQSRANYYNTTSLTQLDLTNTTIYGVNTQQLQLDCITDDTMAATVAAATLSRQLNIRQTGEVVVDDRFIAVEPMDLITIQSNALGMSKKVFRVTEVDESADFQITLKVEEWPFGAAQPTAVATQASAGYVPNYNVAPGSANTPVIFEPPQSLAGSAEIWLATSGGDNWGGCQVYISLDGDTYSQIGTMSAKCRHGYTTATYPSAGDPDNTNTLAVDISTSAGQLTAVTAAVRDLFESLCFVGNASGGELVSYQGATLTGAYRYNLTACRRGCYGSTISAHASGQQFVRLDGNQFQYSYDTSLIGKTIYIKLRSFNKFGTNLEDLSDCTAHAYTVLGAPLGAVSGFTTETAWTGHTLAVKWNALEGATSYTLSLYNGSTLCKQISTSDTRWTATIPQLVAWGLGRSIELRIVAVCSNGQSTTPAVLDVTKSQLAAPTVSVQDTSASMIVTASASSNDSYKATRICISQTTGFDPGAVTPYYDGPQTAYPSGTIAAGTWYVRVCQYDEFGADSLNWTTQVSLVVSSAAVQAADIEGLIQQAQINPGVTWSASQVLVLANNAVEDPDFTVTSKWTLGSDSWFLQPLVSSMTGEAAAGVKNAVAIAVTGATQPSTTVDEYVQQINWQRATWSAGDSVRMRCYINNSSNRVVGMVVYFASDSSGTGTSGIWISQPVGSVGWISQTITIPSGATYFKVGFWVAKGAALTGWARCSLPQLTLAADASLVVDGSITAAKISVSQLSAVSANLGNITAGTMSFSGSGWNFLRSGSAKWLADSNNGWVFAANGSTGEYFSEFYAAYGSGSITERKDCTASSITYLLKIIDSAGVERFTIDPANSRFFFNGNGIFSGTLSAPSGTFGTITAGYLQNSANSCYLNLNATNSSTSPFLGAGGKTLIWGDGHSTLNNTVYQQTVTLNAQPIVGYIASTSTDESGNVTNVWGFTNGVEVSIDTGMVYDSTTYGTTTFAGSIMSSSFFYPTQSGFDSSDFRLMFSVQPFGQLPGPGETWTGVRLCARVRIILTHKNGVALDPYVGTPVAGMIDAQQIVRQYGQLAEGGVGVESTTAVLKIVSLT